MTALPLGELILGPEMISMAFSISDTVIADTQPKLRKALKSLKDAITHFRAVFASTRASVSDLPMTDEQTLQPSAAELRSALDALLTLEHSLKRLIGMLREVLGNKEFRAKLSRPSLPLQYREIADFTKEFTHEWLPFVRKTRLVVIWGIATQAHEHGLEVIKLSPEFREMFMNAAIEETEGWQETAYFLADIEEAKLLDKSIRSAAYDHTGDIVDR